MKTKIWILTAVCFILIGGIILVGAISMLKWDFKGFNTTKYETNTYDIDDSFSDISINTDTSDISFVLSKDGKCRVECYEQSKTKHSVKASGNTLMIDINDTRNWYDYISFFSFGAPEITVYLPKAEYSVLAIMASTGNIQIPDNFTFDSIDIKASTGNISCKASTVNDLKIKLSTGHINAEGITAGSINFTTSTGGISIKSVECSGKLETKVSTGKINLTDVGCESLVSDGSTGDITLTNVIAKNKFDIKRTTGDIRFDKCDANELFVKTHTGYVKGSLMSSKVFICKTETGRVTVPETTEGGKCEITTDTGDIRLEIEE